MAPVSPPVLSETFSQRMTRFYSLSEDIRDPSWLLLPFGTAPPHTHTRDPALGLQGVSAWLSTGVTWGLHIVCLAAHTFHFPLVLLRVANGEIFNEDLIAPSENSGYARALTSPTFLSWCLFVVSSVIVFDM